MKLHQLSLFVENQPGKLRPPCEALADAGINIITLSLADTQQFGILRLIVKDWRKAKEVLEKAGCVVNVTEVVAIEGSADRPGVMARIMKVLEQAKISIEYVYAFSSYTEDKAVMVFRFDDPEAAIAALTAGGINVVGEVELFGQSMKR